MIFKIIGAILIIAIIGIVILLIKGPSDPIVLTDEEVIKRNEQQSKLYENVDLTGFDTVSITGEKVTSDYFKDYKITMINLWTTNCSPCIAEMPDIAKLYDNRPKDSNIISICVDTVDDKDAVEFATKVMSDADAKFLTLIPDAVLQKALTDRANLFPTTIFVDSNGKIVGQPHFGGRTEDDYRQAILDRLEQVEKSK
nr:TlpA disulfide reductase family protein [Tissierella simiarum]